MNFTALTLSMTKIEKTWIPVVFSQLTELKRAAQKTSITFACYSSALGHSRLLFVILLWTTAVQCDSGQWKHPQDSVFPGSRNIIATSNVLQQCSASNVNFWILVFFQHSNTFVGHLVAVLFVSLYDLGDCGPLCALTYPFCLRARTYFRSFPCLFRGRSQKKAIGEQKSVRLLGLLRRNLSHCGSEVKE